jgi:hypothetical protein
MFDSMGKGLPALIANNIAKLAKPDFNDLVVKLGCCGKNVAKMNMHVTRYFLKSLEWLPSFAEFVIFTSFVAIIFLIYEIYHNTKINDRIRKESRCANKKDIPPNSVTAIDTDGNILYNVQYDKDNKNYEITCENDNTGTFQNTYNVNVYDFAGSTTTQPNRTNVTKQCRQPYAAASGTTKSTNNQLYYIGDNQLVEFMKNNNNDYFLNENNEYIRA